MVETAAVATGVAAMIMRGGTSKGVYLLADDLPAHTAGRDALLLAVMGTPDPTQIDGIGGAHPLTSKVAIVSPSGDDTADVDYLFLQLGVNEPTVSERQNCGNLLAGVAPFAIERGLISVAADATSAEVRILFFEGIAGSSTGALLPTGNLIDTFCGIDTTVIDNGMPIVLPRATDVGITGYEDPADLEANDSLRDLLEMIRLKAGEAMNLGDVTDTTVPNMTIVSAPRHGGAFNTRTFIPHRCHQAIGVLGAVAAATGVMIPGAVGYEVLAGNHTGGTVLVEHPTGSLGATVAVSIIDGEPSVISAGIVRTAPQDHGRTALPQQLSIIAPEGTRCRHDASIAG